MWRGNTKVDSQGTKCLSWSFSSLLLLLGWAGLAFGVQGISAPIGSGGTVGAILNASIPKDISRPADNKHALCSHNAVSTPGKD